MTAECPGELLDVLVVEQRVRILLRVGDPDEHVAEREHALGLGAVGSLARVEVRQVEQDQPSREPTGSPSATSDPAPSGRVRRSGLDPPAQPRSSRRPSRRRHAVPSGHAQPVEQLARPSRAPHTAAAGMEVVGRSRADLGQLPARERVEERRLAAAGGPGQGDHGVVAGQGAALPDLGDDLAGGRDRGGVQLVATRGQGVAERLGLGAHDILGGHRDLRPAHQQRAHRAARTAAAAAPRVRAWSGPQLHRVEDGREPLTLQRERGLDAVQQSLLGLRGHRAHGLVTEDRLEQLLPEDGGPAGDADLGAGDPSGVGERHEHEDGSRRR